MIALLFLTCYLILMSYIVYGLTRKELKVINSKQFSFSIIVPAKNEEEYIIPCIDSIYKQNYNQNLFELFVANDRSADKTPDLVKNYIMDKSNFNLININKCADDVDPKINAIEHCLAKSTNEIIIIIDADCIVSKDLLSEYNTAYQNDFDCIAGPVLFTQGRSIFNKIIALDFLSLLSFSAAFIKNKSPVFCSGANFSFKKSSFIQMNGYDELRSIRFADDDLLLQKFSRNKFKVNFLWTYKAIVKTKAPSTLAQFFHQRVRWGSKGINYKDFKDRALMFVIFFLLSLYVFSFFYCLIFSYYNLLVLLVLFKAILDAYVALKTLRKFKQMYLFPMILFYSILHPFYVFIFGILSNVVKAEWK